MAPDGGAGITCRTDSDCPTLYTCDIDVTQQCVFQCNTRGDCTSAEAPPDVQARCQAASGGCNCLIDPVTQLAVCEAATCTTDADCGCLHCNAGTCQ